MGRPKTPCRVTLRKIRLPASRPIAQVNRGALGVCDRREARLLYGVVRERVAGLGADRQSREDRLAERFVYGVLRRIQHRRKQGHARRAPGASETLHDLASGERQTAELPLHEGGEVLRETTRDDAVGVPCPAPAPLVEGQEPVIVEGTNELDDEERISLRLVVDEAAQLHEAWGFVRECVGQQLVNVPER